ncbi:MAG: hypothetical protein PHI98_10405 [Eubacteriales bacterium]|nr:hypothetical protein [Eubacteriales bacterium]
MENKQSREPFVAPQAEVVKLAAVHNAKSWNPGGGKDTTGTGNSGNNPNSGNDKNNGKKN